MPVALFGIPYDGGSSFLRGAASAPPLIRSALWSDASNLWCESGIDLRDHLVDSGDLSLESESDITSQIESAVNKLRAIHSSMICLGGDHSITFPIVRGYHQTAGTFSILQIDAHADLYDEFEGNRLSHACPFARIMEAGLTPQLVQIGIRTLNAHQRQQADRFGVEILSMTDWAAGRRFQLHHPVYISLDLDGIDPAFTPGVSHREPGGFSVREVIQIIHQLNVPIIGADIVEYNPLRDLSDVTAIVAAKLLKEIAGRML